MSTPLLWAYNPIYERTDVEFNLRRSVARQALASPGKLPYLPQVMEGNLRRKGTVKRRKPQVFRRVAAVLAIVALCGHGLAMLLADALLSTAEARPHETPLTIELCTAEGVVLVQLPQGTQADHSTAPGAEDTPGGHGSGTWHDCPICTVFLQQSLVAPASLASTLDAPAETALGGAGRFVSPWQAIAFDRQARAPPIRA